MSILNPDAPIGEVPRSQGWRSISAAVGKGYALDRAARTYSCEEWGVTLRAVARRRQQRLCHRPAAGRLARLAGAAEASRPNRVQSLGDSASARPAGWEPLRPRSSFSSITGSKLGHLLDPRTGWPAAGTASASVTAPTAAEADAMSTAAFVLGAAGAQKLAAAEAGTGAVMLVDRLTLDRPPRQQRGCGLPNSPRLISTPAISRTRHP